MSLETAQDLLNFFDTETHGITASISIDGTSSNISVIINNEYFDIPGDSVDIVGSQPVVHCRSTDVSGVDTSDTITISGITYNIVNIQPDNTGVTVLVLQDT
jgi:hypothetical protein